MYLGSRLPNLLPLHSHYFYLPFLTLTGPSSAISLPLMGIYTGRYRYLRDLLELEAKVSLQPCICWPTCPIPICLEALTPYLACHPDQNFARYIHSGLLHGFHIGFDRTRTNLRATGRNHSSALANPAVITSHIANEVRAGRLVGPLAEGVASHVHISPLGLVPKSHSTNKWRMIVDLSSPVGHSVNDGIDTELTSLAYASIDNAVDWILQLGPQDTVS